MNAYAEKRLKFLEWHRENPHVFELFVRFCEEARDQGHKNLSAWLIVNRIRWETTVITRGGDFKISNDMIAFYARLYMAKDSISRGGFFRIKRMKDEDFDRTKKLCGILE